jgi:tRNA pseudouridine38-40 synthase
MAERNIKLMIEYDGTAYAGWQMQANARSIQGEITEGIRKITGRRVKLIGAGRTDAGVHALGQVANFLIDHELPPRKYRDALNYYLDDDIVVIRTDEVELGFHARFDARQKRYRYQVGRERSAVYRHQRWVYERELDRERLDRSAELILGEHDFSPFCVAGSLKENNRCRIDYSRWFDLGTSLVYEVRGDRFLHHMVRGLVGAMVNLATTEPDDNKNNLTLDRLRNILESPAKERVVFTAPACGLYLVSVGYDEGKT